MNSKKSSPFDFKAIVSQLYSETRFSISSKTTKFFLSVHLKWNTLYLNNNRSFLALRRALKIIDKYFVKLIIEDQDALGSTHGLTQFLKLIDSSVRHRFDAALQKYETSLERWQCFLETFDNLFQTVSTNVYDAF